MDDSVPDAGGPANRPGRDRGPRRPPRRRTNTRVRNGTGTPVRRTPTGRPAPDARPPGPDRRPPGPRRTTRSPDVPRDRGGRSPVDSGHRPSEAAIDVGQQLGRGHRGRPRREGHQPRTRREALRTGAADPAEMGPDLTPKPIAHHRRAHRPGHGEGQPRGFGRSGRGEEHGHRHDTTTDPTTMTPQLLEGAAITDSPDQADRRRRPLRRRDRRTLRPARVDMRARKPCFLARRRLLGWNVRFTGPPRRTGQELLSGRRPSMEQDWSDADPGRRTDVGGAPVRGATVEGGRRMRQHDRRATVPRPSTGLDPDGHWWSDRGRYPSERIGQGYPHVWTSLWNRARGRGSQCRSNRQNSCGQPVRWPCGNRCRTPCGTPRSPW